MDGGKVRKSIPPSYIARRKENFSSGKSWGMNKMRETANKKSEIFYNFLEYRKDSGLNGLRKPSSASNSKGSKLILKSFVHNFIQPASRIIDLSGVWRSFLLVLMAVLITLLIQSLMQSSFATPPSPQAGPLNRSPILIHFAIHHVWLVLFSFPRLRKKKC